MCVYVKLMEENVCEENGTACRFELCHRFAIIIIILYWSCLYVAQIFIVADSTVRRRFYSAFQQRNFHIDGKKSTILHVFAFHSHLFFSFHVRIFFFSCSMVSFDDVMLRFASTTCLCVSYR